jgi:hypothetical protein
MEALEVIGKLWPLLVSFVALVIVLAKMDVRIGTAEEKIKVLFDLHNKDKK